jgi:hypothetical protein
MLRVAQVHLIDVTGNLPGGLLSRRQRPELLFAKPCPVTAASSSALYSNMHSEGSPYWITFMSSPD